MRVISPRMQFHQVVFGFYSQQKCGV